MVYIEFQHCSKVNLWNQQKYLIYFIYHTLDSYNAENGESITFKPHLPFCVITKKHHVFTADLRIY